MLVLSRKPHEKILIPAIRACIHVAAVQPGVVRVAINAPPEVTILRGELAERAAEWGQPIQHQCESPPAPASKPRQARRSRRERLRLASKNLGLARLLLQVGMKHEAAALLAKLQRQVQSLCRHADRKNAQAIAARMPALLAEGCGEALAIVN